MFDELKNLLVSELSVNPDDVTPDAELVSDLGINSIELTDLLLLCEEKFDIKLDDEDARKLLTVDDVVKYIEKNRK